MADTRMRRVKLPIEIIAMVLTELTHAEAWRLRILNTSVNDWVLNVLVKRALQATALVARAPGSFIFYEPPGAVHGLRFSFLSKHGTSALFQARGPPDGREIQDFKKKTQLQIVVHMENNRDPLIIRHLKLRDLTLDRDSVTLMCNWRSLLISAFSMNPQQRRDQALATNPAFAWQPGKIDGMPGKWKKGGAWLYSDSQASTHSQRSTSTASSSQHLYGLVAYDSASGTSSQSHNTQHSNLTQQSNLTQGTNVTTSSGFSTSQLSQISGVPQSSPPRNHSALMISHTNMLHSLSVYPDSSASSDPSRPPDVADGGSGSSVLKAFGLDVASLNPAPPILDPEPESELGPGGSGSIIGYCTSVRDPLTPAPGEVAHVASSPMSDSLAFSATIRPVLRGGGSSPLAGVVEEDEEGGEGGEMSWMYGSERDVSCMLDLVREGETFSGDDYEGEFDEEGEEGEEEGGLVRTESQETGTGTGTTLVGTASVGALSRMDSGVTESTDVEPGYMADEKGKEKALDGVGVTMSLPLAPVERERVVMGRVTSLSPQVVRRTRSDGPVRVGPTSSVDVPLSDVKEL
ncbi:hypothetical protein FRC12_016583 [Ceratobasidium sp. 428]|nr:hypothetical protein FRC12_016583 [Ceratobasidium sp. 428]